MGCEGSHCSVLGAAENKQMACSLGAAGTCFSALESLALQWLHLLFGSWRAGQSPRGNCCRAPGLLPSPAPLWNRGCCWEVSTAVGCVRGCHSWFGPPCHLVESAALAQATCQGEHWEAPAAETLRLPRPCSGPIPPSLGLGTGGGSSVGRGGGFTICPCLTAGRMQGRAHTPHQLNDLGRSCK